MATAHTADDQVETVLMRVLRGSGIDGLTGIPAIRSLSPSVTLVRPLLDVRRQEIEQYLSDLGQDYRTDATNLDSQFSRNWIRRELLPAIRARLQGDPDAAILRLSQQAIEWREAIEQWAAELAAAAAAIESSDPPLRITIDRSTLAHEPPIVVQQACRHAWRLAGWPEQSMGMSDWQRLAAAVIDEGCAGFALPGAVEVCCQRSAVVLART